MSRLGPRSERSSRSSTLKRDVNTPDTTRVTSQHDPFGPPPTRPPSINDVRPPPNDDDRERRHPAQTIGEHRFVVIWLGAFATISFSGLTGLLLDSQWSYASLGMTFAALLVVVLAVSTPRSVTR